MKIFIFTLYMIVCGVVPGNAQRANFYKMSHMVRQLSMEHQQVDVKGTTATRVISQNIKTIPQLCAFVQIKDSAQQVLSQNACKILAQFGDIYIVSIPICNLSKLSLNKYVMRIEGQRSNRLHTDSIAIHLGALPVYKGCSPLPQAYTGKGVVVGVQDVGFDLTHPNFYDSSANNYRIKCFWDQLSVDTIGSNLYVGAAYEGREKLLSYAHSRDGLKQTHGTHTLGIAAGSGYDSKYRGIAYESDICLVSNAIGEDLALIDSVNQYKYTYATDALGFQYIIDYAKQHNQPCVVSFSEGANDDFHGDNILYHTVLERLVSAGHIIVASVGNEGQKKSYFCKPKAVNSMGTFVEAYQPKVHFTLKSKHPFTLLLTAYTPGAKTLSIAMQDVLLKADSIYQRQVSWGNKTYHLKIVAYPSCYNRAEIAYDVTIKTKNDVGVTQPFSFAVKGNNVQIEAYRVSGNWTENALNKQLCAGELTHSINSPANAPSVIAVGATSYRTAITNYLGERRIYNQGTNGERGAYSSVGPTYDGRIKPDVMAPGTNIISSYSSYYLEANPTANDIKSDVEHFNFRGRTYAWNSNAGTSMSTPAVAGAIALWLQAKPTLTQKDIIDVFAHTCSQYDASLSYPNNWYGYGQIDVYKGLLYILGVDNIEGISPHQPFGARFIVASNGIVKIKLQQPTNHYFSVSVYSLSGMLLTNKRYLPGCSVYQLDLSQLKQGVYLLQLNSKDKAVKGSTLIRK